MPIDERGDWGADVVCPCPIVECRRDDRIVTASPGVAVTLTGGNLWRALGRPGAARPGTRALALDVDAVVVSAGSTAPMMGADSVVLRRPWWKGGLLRGRITLISNSGMHGDRSLLPRAHPNDGEWDRLEIDPGMGVKARLIAWARSRRGDHLPHPALTVSRVTEAMVVCEASTVVCVDGRRRVRLPAGTTVGISVLVDHWRVLAASPTV
jgi:hypothetical protein